MTLITPCFPRHSLFQTPLHWWPPFLLPPVDPPLESACLPFLPAKLIIVQTHIKLLTDCASCSCTCPIILTIGGVEVTGPNGAGKFILFIRCRTYKNATQKLSIEILTSYLRLVSSKYMHKCTRYAFRSSKLKLIWD